MKGTPEAPACGFSARTVAALQALGAPFAAVDILPDPRIRQELSALSNWPTIPQLFVNGELVGGCDIVTEMYESGELAETLGVEAPATRRRRRADRPTAALAPLGIENRLASLRLGAAAAGVASRHGRRRRAAVALRWDGRALPVLDQTLLPAREAWLELHRRRRTPPPRSAASPSAARR